MLYTNLNCWAGLERTSVVSYFFTVVPCRASLLLLNKQNWKNCIGQFGQFSVISPIVQIYQHVILIYLDPSEEDLGEENFQITKRYKDFG